ncbi:hypothetical protein Tco_0664698 [Tanacetum coccineum]
MYHLHQMIHLSHEVLNLEKEKDAQAVEILNLKKRVKKLERKRKSSISHPRRRKYRQVETSSDDGLDEEDASKQGRRSDAIKLMFIDKDFEELDDHMENIKEETVNAATTGVSTKAKEKGVAIIDVEDSSSTVRPVRSITTLQPLPTIDPKDKGKGVLAEKEPVKIKKKDQGDLQIQADAELAQRLHEEELAELERKQKERLQLKEREQFTIKERAQFLVETIAAQRKFRAAQRAAEIRRKTYEEIHGLYERKQKRNQDFIPMDTEVINDGGKKNDSSSKPARGSRKKTLARKRAGEKKSKESAKKQKLEDVAKEQESAKSDE